jgi:N-acetylglucosaminyldiphosphoundecaprenol N-acetyl-beta-D-mannosaminyltransferase
VAANEVSDHVERLSVMRVPVDSIEMDRLAAVAQSLVATDGLKQIVLLRWWDYMRARRNRQFRACVRDSLSVPVSRSVAMAARFLTSTTPARFMPFDLVVQILTSLEERSQSVYLLGGSGAAIRVMERNVRETFPGLRIVGRYAGYYAKEMEPSIITAIRKASPDLLLVGPGVPGHDLWIHRNRANVGARLALFSAEVFNIFSERRPRTSRTAFRRGLDFFPDLFRKPWRVLRLFVYLWFLLFLLVFRVFKIR